MEKMPMQTGDLAALKFAALAALFPNAVTEVITGYEKDRDGGDIIAKPILRRAVDAEALQQEINGRVLTGEDERYRFTWPGKNKSVVLSNAPINATLRPCREESVDFDTTENLYIEGDNLEALKLLRKTYFASVKMIYIDPPYNTGNNFIYNDKFKVGTGEWAGIHGDYADGGRRLVKSLDSNGRFHTDWLNMIYPRLRVARDLLTDDGVIFISIDDNEVENLKKLCDEVFGEDNHLGTFIVNSTPNARDYGHIGKMHEYALFYAKNAHCASTNMVKDDNKRFKYKDKISGFNIHTLHNSNVAFDIKNRPNLFYPFYINTGSASKDGFFEIGLMKREGWIEVYPPKSVKGNVQFVWRWGKEKSQLNLNKEIIGYRTVGGEYRIVQKMRHSEKLIRSILFDTRYSSRRGTAETEEIFGGKMFSFPKPTGLLEDFISTGMKRNDIVLDFFAGSATTAHAVMKLNAADGGKRKYILVQIPEICAEKSEAFKAGYMNICEIGKERIRRAGRKIMDESAVNRVNFDVGFRVLKLDSSNMKDTYYTGQTTDLIIGGKDGTVIDSIKEDRTAEDLLFQIMLDAGIPLSASIEVKSVSGSDIHYVRYGTGLLIACFGKTGNEVITKIAMEMPDFAVFRIDSFESDSAFACATRIFTAYSPDTKRRVL